ncbi:PilC/PilY family type IV pilus protein [uncultured Desulfobacter sp.]|uniref:PilC/PilY family type IV pilus protein n=1 Tax=uncultured Desulfobacter sp. TaxID=240139 RepID=UPI002AA90961|nr:PilC/PilY family type IV pilus protein [uncultured Desulfobacter sp.]
MFRKSMSTAIYPMLFIFIHSLVFSPFPAKAATSSDYQAVPPFVTAGVPPLVMLVMGRNHKLYYEAYNDASDLNGDGTLDVGYNPAIDYYGYFDSYKYYAYVSGSNRFEPRGKTSDKKAADGDYWSGDFLNYLTMSRMDCLRKVLYGGFRYTDTSTETVLERSFIPQDAHSWGKEYYSIDHDGYDIQDYTPLDQPKGDSRHLFVSTSLSNTGNPLLRVLENSVLRIWEWVAIERPVAGDQGNDGSGRRSILDNNVSGGVVDVTTSGTAGTMDDSYVAGGGEISINDDFDDGSLAGGWQTADNEGHTGTSFDETGGQLIIKGAGADVWTGNDEFAAVYLDNISGDFDFRLKVDSQQNTNGWAKTGIMVRNDMTRPKVSTGYCMIAVTPSSGFAFQTDSNANGYLDSNSSGGSATPLPKWVRLTKVGQVFTGYYSDTNSNWTQRGTATLTTASTEQDVGIFATSHNASALSECKYDKVSITGTGGEPDPELAFDDDDNTLWIYPDEPDTDTAVWIQFQFASAREIKSYSINGGTDAPDDWTLMGSNDGTSWTELDSETDAGLTDGNSETFECDETGEYTYYRINISGTSNAEVDGVAIREIEMMEETEPIPANATLTDHTVRVKVCDPSVGVESNSKLYPSGVYKPIGLLQRHGESDRMYFGLLTGSYTKNTSGGALRKNIRSITDEINATTGQFRYKESGSTVNGIIKTIDLFRVVDFDYGSSSYNSNCGWITTRALKEGECRMWGNPVAEMMYETLRYFSGAKTPTGDFTYDTTSTHDDNELGLPKPGWLDPYTNGEDINGNGSLDTGEDINANGELDGFDYCAKPFMLVLSDISPTYDSDQLPGSDFNPSFSSSSLGDLDVGALANTITAKEEGLTTHFIGEAASYDGACTPKTVSDLGAVRGLCPEEPTKQGSYYSASVAYYGNQKDLHGAAAQDQSVATYCVGLASPLPRIEITVGTNMITLVPFAKSVGGSSISADEGKFQPTNTIVDFFVEEITPASGKFRINYEDVEQGADHDMDAVVEYIYQVQDSSGNAVSDPTQGTQVEISLNSSYAAGGIIQHMGYIISGTTKDGTYLEVRDKDTGEGSDPDYFLDTPPGEDPGGDWDDDTYLPLTATRTFIPGTGGTVATLLKNPLWYAAKWGGFEDYDGDGYPNQDNEWDKDSDGTPDTYFYVQNPLKLEEELNRSFADILRRTASGTAASVISQTRSGEGAVYQAVFYPEFKGPLGNTINWAGQIHSLFVDSYGNMREDTNGDAKLDLKDDRIIVFDGSIVKKYYDSDGDEEIEDGQTPEFSGSTDDINFVWSSSDWLNEMTDDEVTSQRIYTAISRNRYVFTFIDKDGDMVADDGEQQEFVSTAVPTDTDMSDTSKIFPYLNIYPTFENEPSVNYNGASVSMNTFRSYSDDFKDFIKQQSYRVINYIRGEDQGEYVSGTTPSYTLPAFRSRQVDYDDDGTMETWRLGDIVYSTPTIVGRPAENYHLLYRDTSYAEFASHFQNRRNMVYTGANDGMIHAFNGGFYDDDNKEFKTKLTTASTEKEYQLGSEMWAYIPFNLLPHLYWLTETDYPHVYYCDLKPKIFEAKILPDDTHYTDSDTEPNWGTFLVVGMRFGGGRIQADLDKTDGNTATASDPVMSSAYVIMDITNPELPPKVMAEIKLEGMGYTTCYPTVVPMKDKDATTGTIKENDWYLVFGSGPASSAGIADGNGGSGALDYAISKQKAKLYVVDLKELGLNNTVKTLDDSGSFTTAPAGASAHDYYVELDENSFVSDPITVDYNLDFNADVVYFGTVAGDNGSGWSGKMRRMVFDNKLSPSDWKGDSVFLETAANQTIVTAPSVGIDDNDFRWVYFGTGRFFVRGDAAIAAESATTGLQSYYAVKEPFTDANSNGVWDLDSVDASGEKTEPMTWGQVTTASMLDVSDADVYGDKKVTGLTDIDGTTTIGNWDSLMTAVDKSDGWYLDFEGLKERNLGQATLFGELLTFTTYIPSDDICSFEGTSNLYAVYYKTGTAYYLSAIGSSAVDREGDGQENDVKITRVISLGKGLSVTPNIHVGKQEGSKAFVQTSTGSIETIDQINPGDIKSGIISWEAVD